MNNLLLLAYIAVAALITYLPRVVPLAVFRRKIKNRFIQSFLLYMPYGILAAMVFPAVLYSTAGLFSAICGGLAALVLAWKQKGLLTVAAGSTLSRCFWPNGFFPFSYDSTGYRRCYNEAGLSAAAFCFKQTADFWSRLYERFTEANMFFYN